MNKFKLFKKATRKYIVRLGDYTFTVDAEDKDVALNTALAIWSDNEDVYPETFRDYSVEEAPEGIA